MRSTEEAAPMEQQAWTLSPIAIAEHSYFWVGVERQRLADGEVATTGKHMYVEYFVPAERRHEYPLVLVHGGGGQGVAFYGRGDGKPGWLHHALAAGYVVYVLDRPGHGRNPPHSELIGPIDEPTPYSAVASLFKVGADGGRWAGTGEVGDPGLDDFMAQQRPMRFDTAAAAHALSQTRGAELLDRIGPAILLTHSAGGPFAWVVADARPQLVKALVAVEAIGPSTVAIPLTFDPPIQSTDELELVPLPDDPSIEMGPLARLPRVVQAEPPRRLASLAQVPIAVVTSDDPAFGALNAATIAFLRQAGCSVDELRLAEHGIRGNGHFMLLEENNAEVLGVILDWLARTVG
jgi:pimeloyl-ACP methyl ester carboxylesterase